MREDLGLLARGARITPAGVRYMNVSDVKALPLMRIKARPAPGCTLRQRSVAMALTSLVPLVPTDSRRRTNRRPIIRQLRSANQNRRADSRAGNAIN